MKGSKNHGELRVLRLDHLVLTVRDLPRTRDFYRRALGLEPVTFDGDRTALRFGDQKLNLHAVGAFDGLTAGDARPGTADLCFVVDGALGPLAARLGRLGIDLVAGPVRRTGALGPMTSIYFRDPDGNLVEVATYEGEVAEVGTEQVAAGVGASAASVTPARRRYRLYQVDAFTHQAFHGNPAGVVPDAIGLSDEEMQAIARELGNPETAFILPAAESDDGVRVRFFTPTTEVPLCGHATLAAHHVRAVEGAWDPADGRVLQRSPGGTWSIEMAGDPPDERVWLIQEPVLIGPPLSREHADRLLHALGVLRSDLQPGGPIEIVSTGHSKVLIGLASRRTLDGVTPDREALIDVSRETGVDGFFLFTLDSAEEDVLTECRMFAPAIGIDEDPVTGSGQGPLGVYLVRHGLLPADRGRARFRSLQGQALGRPGIAEVAVEVEGGEPARVRVGGQARIVFRAELELG